jgi:hypothetical protein
LARPVLPEAVVQTSAASTPANASAIFMSRIVGPLPRARPRRGASLHPPVGMARRASSASGKLGGVEESTALESDEPRLILGVPGVGAGLLARSSVDWLLYGEVELEPSRLRTDLTRWLEQPLPGRYFGVASVAEEELAWFKTLIQRAGWSYRAPNDVQELQLAVARAGAAAEPGTSAPA